jgi:hypothetical protein
MVSRSATSQAQLLCRRHLVAKLRRGERPCCASVFVRAVSWPASLSLPWTPTITGRTPGNLREILRVLKPGGTFALIAETYRGGPFRLVYGMVMRLLRAAFLSEAEHRDLLTEAGFTEVTIKHVSGKNWICATGRRPT